MKRAKCLNCGAVKPQRTMRQLPWRTGVADPNAPEGVRWTRHGLRWSCTTGSCSDRMASRQRRRERKLAGDVSYQRMLRVVAAKIDEMVTR